MQVTVTIVSTFVDATGVKMREEERERRVCLDIPDDFSLTRFGIALMGFAHGHRWACHANDLKVIIPYRMSWDPVIKIHYWFASWLQEVNPA